MHMFFQFLFEYDSDVFFNILKFQQWRHSGKKRKYRSPIKSSIYWSEKFVVELLEKIFQNSSTFSTQFDVIFSSLCFSKASRTWSIFSQQFITIKPFGLVKIQKLGIYRVFQPEILLNFVQTGYWIFGE